MGTEPRLKPLPAAHRAPFRRLRGLLMVLSNLARSAFVAGSLIARRNRSMSACVMRRLRGLRTYRQRIADLSLTERTPDFCIIAGGFNDYDKDAAALRVEVAATIQAARGWRTRTRAAPR